MTMNLKVKTMTKLFTRKPHPARRARIATAGLSSTAFLMIISSFAWNTHAAELAASSTTLVPETPVAPATTATDAAVPTVPTATTPAPVVSTAPAATAQTPAATAPKKKKAKAATNSTATTTAPAAPATPAAAPAAPAAPTVVYTCKSPGGKTENPTSKGTCKNARYGYVLTQI